MLAAVERVQGPRGEGPCHWPGCPSVWQQVDHITPRNRGGTDDPENLQGLCAFHNAQKGDGSKRPTAVAGAGTTSRVWH